MRNEKHANAEKDSRIVHAIKGTAANVPDATMSFRLLTEGEAAVFGDSGDLRAEKREMPLHKEPLDKRIRYKLDSHPSWVKSNLSDHAYDSSADNTKNDPFEQDESMSLHS